MDRNTSLQIYRVYFCSEGFNILKYQGTWYEVVRAPNMWFENSCANVSANYSLLDHGNVRVENRWKVNGKEKSSVGVAKVKYTPDIGALKVSFWRPFWGDYKIIELGKNYEYVVVVGSTAQYFWILSRGKTLDKDLVARILKKAKANGFDVENFVYTVHSAWHLINF